MEEFIIQSKIYVPASEKTNTLFICINAVMLLIILLTIVSFFLFGFNLANVGTAVLAAVISLRIKSLMGRKDKYESCVSKAVFGEKALIIKNYRSYVNQVPEGLLCEVIMPYAGVTALEFSDILSCLRIAGEAEYRDAASNRTRIRQEYLFYMSASDLDILTPPLFRKTEINIKYMDRSK